MKKKLLRTFCFLTLAAIAGVQLNAAVSAEIEKLVVELNNDTRYVYQLADKPVVTFEDDSIKVASTTASAKYLRTDVKNFHFGDATVTGIKNAGSNDIILTYLDNENVSLTGRALSGVKLYNAEGKLLSKPESDGTGVSVSLKGYAPGVYLLCVPGHITYKLIKK